MKFSHFGNLSAYLIIIFITISTAQHCSLSARTVQTVQQCPKDKENTTIRAKIKRCERLVVQQTCSEPSTFKYHCLPSDKGTLVEVCAVETYINGICVFYDKNDTRIQTDESRICSRNFKCPERFLSSEAHLYEPCQEMTLPNNPFQNTPDPLHTTVYIFIAVTGIILFGIGLTCFVRIRRNNRREYNNGGEKDKEEENEEKESVSLLHRGGEKDKEEENVEKESVSLLHRGEARYGLDSVFSFLC